MEWLRFASAKNNSIHHQNVFTSTTNQSPGPLVLQLILNNSPPNGLISLTSSNSPWRKFLVTSNCSSSKSFESTIYNMILTEDMLNNCGKYLIVVDAPSLETPFVTSLDLHRCLFLRFLLYTHLHPMIFTIEALVQCSMYHSLLVRTSHLL